MEIRRVVKKSFLLLLTSYWAGAAFNGNLVAAPPDQRVVPPGVPQTLRAQGEDPERIVTSAFTTQVGGHDVVVTLHSRDREEEGSHVALSTWLRSNGSYRLITRLELDRYAVEEIQEFRVDGKEFVKFNGCAHHMMCSWDLYRIEPSGQLTKMILPKEELKRLDPVLNPGESLFGFDLRGDKSLGFVEYVCLTKTDMRCWLGDQWQYHPGWGPAGPQVYVGRFEIRGNTLRVVDLHRQKFEANN